VFEYIINNLTHLFYKNVHVKWVIQKQAQFVQELLMDLWKTFLGAWLTSVVFKQIRDT